MVPKTELEKIAKIWQIQLNLEYSNPKKNVRLAFKDIGAFAELMALDYAKGFVGSGSGGMGFDLVNYSTHKAIEVKSCCTIQNSICANSSCGTKFNSLFVNKCPKCQKNEYKTIADSRFGIDAKEFLAQYTKNMLQGFYFCYVSLESYNKDTTNIKILLKWFKLEFNDSRIKKIQLEYFETQKAKGKGHCNLLPCSFDFYKLAPTPVSEVTMSFPVNDLSQNPVIQEQKITQPLRVCLDVMHNEKEREAFKKLASYDDKTKTAEIIDFTTHIPYAKKSLGKKRGDTRRKVYRSLE